MYAFLLLLGAASTAGGIALVASGVAHEGAAAVTPGTIAALGGLVLIGLGLVVRELQRIERALSARPMPRPARPGEAPAATDMSRIPFPPKPKLEAPKTEPHPQAEPLAASGMPAPAEQPEFETLRDKFPTLVRLDTAAVVEETDVSLLPQARAEEVVSEAETRAAAGRVNGAPARFPTRLDVHARTAAAAPAAPVRLKGAMFDAFWPKGQRPRRDAQAAVQAVAQAPSPESMQATSQDEAVASGQPTPEPRIIAPAPAPTGPVSILKSGMVEGMAYTLYSDGSIEAQLPQGTLRFGSIAELRNHIENS